MNEPFNLITYLQKSTQSSGVPLKVKSKVTLSAIAALISKR
jgi:hypothetical protein